jgi:hypothetical protein
MEYLILGGLIIALAIAGHRSPAASPRPSTAVWVLLLTAAVVAALVMSS